MKINWVAECDSCDSRIKLNISDKLLSQNDDNNILEFKLYVSNEMEDFCGEEDIHILAICGWYLDDIWAIFGQYLDNFWAIFRQ